MTQKSFSAGTKLESNTCYRFDPAHSHIFLNETVSVNDAKYLTIPGGAVHLSSLDTAFYLHDLENVTLDFDGAVITLHGRIQPFLIDRCKNITIKNVTVEYERALYSELEILEHTDGVLRTRPYKHFPCRIENGYFIPYAKEWENRSIHSDGCLFMQAYEKSTRDGAGLMVIYLGEEIVELDSPPVDNIPHIKVRADGDDILFFGDFPESWDSSKSIVLEHEGRDISSAACYHSENITFANYRILNGGGMGLYAVYTKNISLHAVKFCHDSLSHGVVSNSADGIHFVACKGKIELTDSIFEGTIDDALNIHANYYHTVRGEKNVVYARRSHLSHGLSAYSRVFGIGDEIAVYRGRTMEEKARFTVREVRITGEWTIELVVDRPADDLCAEDLIENLSTNPEIFFRNTRFAKSNAHLRLQTRGKAIVEDCYFTLPILLTGDMNYWFESSPIKDLTIRHCTFAGERAKIMIIPEFTATEAAPYYHSGIKVLENTFDCHTPLMTRDTSDIIFLDNCSSDGGTLEIVKDA